MDEKNVTDLPDGENIQQQKSTTYGQIVKFTGVLGGTQMLTMVVSLVRNKLATVFLGAAGMGLVALYQNVMTFVSNITNLGLPMSTIKHVSDRMEHRSTDYVEIYVSTIRTWVVATAITPCTWTTTRRSLRKRSITPTAPANGPESTRTRFPFSKGISSGER